MPDSRFHQPGNLQFFGSPSAKLFSREVEESLQGVLHKNFIADPADPMAGFLSASVDGRPWTDTMWTRDAGTFLRELVHFGYFHEACLAAERLMDLVQPNPEGYLTFPMYFERGKPGSGSEVDGTGAIIIALVRLWERLPQDHPIRLRIYSFLTGVKSPLAYFEKCLAERPFITGTGEFGGGMGIEGEFFNVVQNGLVSLSLHAAAQMAKRSGDSAQAAHYRQMGDTVFQNMLRYFRDASGGWVWTVDARTLLPNPAVNDHPINQGMGGINGVLAMAADVLGFNLLEKKWAGVEPGLQTFERLLQWPIRRAMFDRYGVWTQFDRFILGLSTGPSYGHGYALQTMLLTNQLVMADKALDFLARITYQPFPHNQLDRESPYHFYERIYLPEMLGREHELTHPLETGLGVAHFDQGCGALNLVNVAEPLKAARLVMGLDDFSGVEVRLVPRLPPSWQGYRAENWPIRTRSSLLQCSITCEREGNGLKVTVKGKGVDLEIKTGTSTPNLALPLFV